MKCPKCGGDYVRRGEVDVGVGTIYGPYGCYECGWVEDDRCNTTKSPAPIEDGLKFYREKSND